MRVAIVGSRDYPNTEIVRAYVRSLPPDTVVVSGGAEGVDRAAESEALACGLASEIYPVDESEVRAIKNARGLSWRGAYGVVAHARNRVIAARCDRLVAFSFQASTGTASTVRYAEEKGKPTKIFEWPDIPKLDATAQEAEEYLLAEMIAAAKKVGE